MEVWWGGILCAGVAILRAGSTFSLFIKVILGDKLYADTHMRSWGYETS